MPRFIERKGDGLGFAPGIWRRIVLDRYVGGAGTAITIMVGDGEHDRVYSAYI